MGSEFWEGIIKWTREIQLKNEYISSRDLDLFSVTDDPQEACRIITEFHKGKKHTTNF
jgi:predicted Rossmann-fold nucleotide-binding protein